MSSSHRVHVDDVDADDADVETRARAVQSRHLRRTTRINLPSYNPGAGWAPQGTAAHISYLLDEQSRGLKWKSQNKEITSQECETALTSQYGTLFFVFLSFCLFVFLSFCLFVFLSFIWHHMLNTHSDILLYLVLGELVSTSSSWTGTKLRWSN